MLNFIVLGQIPGTGTQLDFSMLINVAGTLGVAFLLYVLVKRYFHRAKDALIEFLSLEMISL